MSLLIVALVLVVAVAGYFVWKKYKADGTHSLHAWGVGILAALATVWEAISHGISGLFN